MKLNEKKEKLLQELNDVNYEVFIKVHDGDCFHDITGNHYDHFVEALRYVQNRLIKKLIKNCKTEVKQHKRIENDDSINYKM